MSTSSDGAADELHAVEEGLCPAQEVAGNAG